MEFELIPFISVFVIYLFVLALFSKLSSLDDTVVEINEDFL